MPAITVPDIMVLPRLPRPTETMRHRAVRSVVSAPKQREGAGFEVRRPFPSMDLRTADPFILLDQMGPVAYEPHEAKGAPWHPHRGFEIVTYVMDGTMVHHDSNGGGGVIGEGDTQWMTAGSGILHDELPAEELVVAGGWFHGIQLWVNLPRALKFAAPRYQDLRGSELTLVTSHDGGALVRLIAGSVGGFDGPGSTYTPIAYAHASISPGGQLETPWPQHFTAMAYILSGSGTVGAERRPVREGQLAVFGQGDAITVSADAAQHNRSGELEMLLLGGRPIKEPVVQYGPFVMNTRAEIIQAMDDYQAGRMGNIPAEHLAGHRLGE
ncbi:pirin family protein [Nocardia brasiliensis]|uniref:Pirin domain-containing protein n=1 Tax=Nocardia brasiliensis (strain ATCC 700358 / HUJEG-1) TaxID=1133849 RepID=K0ER62_NOCB7|nr:pirin family protein [Nocardia brasiliensis]AFT99518.1 Pirin domain-containing protein [Nocardia brasiliensis ATCC 700358]OCF90470.1 pirin [Nocardia brasiliensis]